jgi:hypothetical protein
MIPELETARLLLKPLEIADAEQICGCSHRRPTL